jgi:hypothetical protein
MAVETYPSTEYDGIDLKDFQQVLSVPSLAYDEGMSFLRGGGLMNKTLKQLVKDLDKYGIDYCLIGAIALNRHGYNRFTTDIDLIMTEEGLMKFGRDLVGRGYRPAFNGATKKFRATEENVPIEVIITGEYPGDGKPKPIVFPDPAECSVVIDGAKTVRLEKLVELKLASGMSGLDRLKDLADVQEMIRLLSLDAEFAQLLDASVRDKYLELHDAIVRARAQADAPDRDH